MKVPASCDIFCAVIDNYGDVGVCWRLARQLAAEYDIDVRLWVDDLLALRHIWPAVDAAASIQRCAGVDVHRWEVEFGAVTPAELVIEAFGCELPEVYIKAMSAQAAAPVWINLEYLSAEDWVADCHGLPSPQPHGAPLKYFFFPGFTAATGGLPRERDLPERRRAFQRDVRARNDFLARFGVTIEPGAICVSLFAYENDALPPLLEIWSRSARPIVCLVPEGRPLAAVARFFGAEKAGAAWRRGALTAIALPFLLQDDYDLLLWSCDVNFVRGEDSFVRAQWAGRPFVWHIYPQAGDAHWPKLEAFLALYRTAQPAAADTMAALWRAWNGRGAIADAWREFAEALPAQATAAGKWSQAQTQRRNLADALVQFCANHV